MIRTRRGASGLPTEIGLLLVCTQESYQHCVSKETRYCSARRFSVNRKGNIMRALFALCIMCVLSWNAHASRHVHGSSEEQVLLRLFAVATTPPTKVEPMAAENERPPTVACKTLDALNAFFAKRTQFPDIGASVKAINAEYGAKTCRSFKELWSRSYEHVDSRQLTPKLMMIFYKIKVDKVGTMFIWQIMDMSIPIPPDPFPGE